MADLFKDMLKDSESLFINEIALDLEYIPKEIPFRENQQHYIATCIKPLLQGRLGKNLLIFGSPGIGKTVATKHILRELEEKGLDEQAKPIYINCWKKDTSYKIALEICDQLNYKFTQNRNTDDLLKEIARILNKKAAIIVLDEVDKLDDPSIIYTLLEDIYKKSIFLITNEKSWINQLDDRVKSRLMPEVLEFKPYNLKEVEGILKQRAEYALVPNTLEKEAFELITQKTYELNDIRAGLFLIKESTTIAESQSSRKILLKHASEAAKKLTEFKIKSSKDLKEDSYEILQLIKEESGKTIAQLHEIYNKKEPISYRNFFRKIQDLSKSGRINLKIDEEQPGKPTIVEYDKEKKLTEF